MPVTDCHRCGTLVACDPLLTESRCTPCALAERDAYRDALAALVAARDELRRLVGTVDLLTPETHREWELAYEAVEQRLDDCFDAARRLLADGVTP